MSEPDAMVLAAIIVAVAVASLGTSMIMSRQSPPPPVATRERRGCQFCGTTCVSTESACFTCQNSERRYRELRQQETRLRVRLLQQQLKQEPTSDEPAH